MSFWSTGTRNFAQFRRVQPFTPEGFFMHWLYDYFFLAVWIAFLLYWHLKSRDTKATQVSEGFYVSKILRFDWLLHPLFPRRYCLCAKVRAMQ
jgi:hypothetical protein